MTDLPTPSAKRLQRPSWRDSRLILGVVLVLASTVLGSVTVARAGNTVPVYAASSVLVAGQRLTLADISRVDVRLGPATSAYLSAEHTPPVDGVVLRDLRPGELIPISAVGTRTEVGVQPVTILVDATSAGVLVTGSVVDVYVNRPDPKAVVSTAGTGYAGPDRVLEAVTVLRVGGDQGVLGSRAQTRSVQVLVPRARVTQLVGDVDAGAKITLVPVPGSLLGAAS